MRRQVKVDGHRAVVVVDSSVNSVLQKKNHPEKKHTQKKSESVPIVGGVSFLRSAKRK